MVEISFKKFYNRFLYVTGLYMCDPWEQKMCFALFFGFIFTLLVSAFVFLPSHATGFYSYLQIRRSLHNLANEV